MNERIVSAEWLNNHLDDQNLILLDASQLTNKMGVLTDTNSLQIPGAITFDIKKEFRPRVNSHLNRMPSAEEFEQACRKIGINRSSKIIVYDNLGIYFSPRVWWMFRTMGHKEIAVLDGGLPNWISNGFKIESIKSVPHQVGDFRASLNKGAIKQFDFIQKNLLSREFLVIDARDANRFQGKSPEPRVGIKSGNIPFSKNLPFTEVLENGKYKKKEELIAIFKRLKIDQQPLIFNCGSGITACIILLACEMVCENNLSLYNGSWTEWAERNQNLNQ